MTLSWRMLLKRFFSNIFVWLTDISDDESGQKYSYLAVYPLRRFACVATGNKAWLKSVNSILLTIAQRTMVWNEKKETKKQRGGKEEKEIKAINSNREW